MMPSETVTIPKEEYEGLKRAALWELVLIEIGVRDWLGHEQAVRLWEYYLDTGVEYTDLEQMDDDEDNEDNRICWSCYNQGEGSRGYCGCGSHNY